MMLLRTNLAAGAVLALLNGTGHATSLQISPVLIDLAGAAAAAKIAVSNAGDKPIHAQIRVFKWSQKDGKDVVEPTQDVVASPPIATIEANSEQIVRIVRLDRSPLSREASYRLLIDQIPDRSAPTRSAVTFAMRYSVPVFFAPAHQAAPKLTWSLAHRNGVATLTATNSGSRRVRIAELGISRESGATVAARKGLLGYVLGGSTASWEFPGVNLPRGTTVSITARGDDGPIDATTTAR